MSETKTQNPPEKAPESAKVVKDGKKTKPEVKKAASENPPEKPAENKPEKSTENPGKAKSTLEKALDDTFETFGWGAD